MNWKCSFGRAAAVAALAIASAARLPAEPPRTALEIIRTVDQADRAGSSKLTLAMSVVPADGGAARDFSILTYENASGDSLVEFLEPRTVKGMRILSRGNNSWVFFPSTGRIRKIGSSSRGGSVQGVGGDFSYDDLGGGTWEENYAWTLIGENARTWELEGTRRSADSAYDGVRMTVDKTLQRPIVCLFSLASEGGPYKRLDLSDFRDFSGRTRPSRMVMRNLKKGSSTEVRLAEAVFDIPLESALFDPSRFNR